MQEKKVIVRLSTTDVEYLIDKADSDLRKFAYSGLGKYAVERIIELIKMKDNLDYLKQQLEKEEK